MTTSPNWSITASSRKHGEWDSPLKLIAQQNHEAWAHFIGNSTMHGL